MSEYVRKQALVEWLDESIQTLRGLAIGFRNQGNELAERGCHRDADGLYVIMKKIQSGAFDAEPNGEVQRLRAVAIKLHETINSFWQGDCDKADVVAAQSKLCDVLSTTTKGDEIA